MRRSTPEFPEPIKTVINSVVNGELAFEFDINSFNSLIGISTPNLVGTQIKLQLQNIHTANFGTLTFPFLEFKRILKTNNSYSLENNTIDSSSIITYKIIQAGTGALSNFDLSLFPSSVNWPQPEDLAGYNSIFESTLFTKQSIEMICFKCSKLLFSGAKLSLCDLGYLSSFDATAYEIFKGRQPDQNEIQQDRSINSFTLKIEGLPSNTSLTSNLTLEDNVIPYSTLGAPCPPLWRPGFSLHIEEIDGVAKIETVRKNIGS